MSEIVPCVVFAYNRPDKLERILSALKPQNVDSLLIFIDGPRSRVDIETVGYCRKIAEGIDWIDKQVYLGEQNRGSARLDEKIAVVLDDYSAAIFLEDDCLPMPGFYTVMRQALVYYEAQEDVFSIGGYQPIPLEFFDGYPYSFISSRRFMGWGWATWQDRWFATEYYRSRFAELFDGLRSIPDIAGSDLQRAARACASGKVQDWDTKVSVAIQWLGKVHLATVKGLIRNIGLDGSGTHEGQYTNHFHNQNVCECFQEEINWLDDVRQDENYNARLRRFIRDACRPTRRTFWRWVKAGIRTHFSR